MSVRFTPVDEDNALLCCFRGQVRCRERVTRKVWFDDKAWYGHACCDSEEHAASVLAVYGPKWAS